MGTKYSTQTISGYNASPPADDGSQSASNQITWAKHKTKLGDPLKTLAEAINTALVADLNMEAVQKTDTYTVTAAEHKKTVEFLVTSAGADAILLSAATAAAGFMVTVSNAPGSTANITVKLATATDTINEVTNGAVVLPSDCSATFIVNPSTNGYIVKNAHGVVVNDTRSYKLAGPTAVSAGATQTINLVNMPAGIIAPYAGSSVPTGWLACDGSAVSRTTYSALFTAISTTWGAGDGSTTFNVPNFGGKSLIGDGTGVTSEVWTAGAVDTSADTITVNSNADKWVTGMAVTLSTGSSLPNGLSAGVTYYVVRNTATTIKLASSLANATGGATAGVTVINITSQGTGESQIKYTHTARTVGQYGGEETHAMSSTELLAHSHDVRSKTGTGTPYDALSGNNTSNADVPTDFTGGNAAMNNMQPYGVVKYIISY